MFTQSPRLSSERRLQDQSGVHVRRSWGSLTAFAVIAVLVAGVATSASAVTPPTPPEGRGVVYGVISHDDPGEWDYTQARVELTHITEFSSWTETVGVEPDGSYVFPSVYGGNLTMRFIYLTKAWTTSTWRSAEGKAVFQLVAGQVFEANGVQRLGATVTGIAIPPEGETLSSHLSVFLWSSPTQHYSPTKLDTATGTYEFSGVAPGDYILSVDDRGSKSVGKAYWGGAPTPEAAARFVVAPGSALTGMDISLPLVRALSGTVVHEVTPGVFEPAINLSIQLKRVSDGKSTGWVTVDRQGRWMHGGEEVAAGRYQIYAWPHDDAKQNIMPTYWSDGAEIELVEGVHQRDIQIVMRTGGAVTVRLTDPDGSVPDDGGYLQLITVDESTGARTLAGYAQMDKKGVARIQRLEPGSYIPKLRGRIEWDRGVYPNGATTFADASPITVEDGVVVDLGTQVVVYPDVPIRRLTGKDRYEMSAVVSKELFPSGSDVPVIYLLNGLKYPDALAAGPAAIEQGGGLLLVKPTAVPSSVSAELKRLSPDRIVVVGGTESISDSVLETVAAENPGSIVERLGGATRYDTAALVVRDAFPEAPPVVYLTTGKNFPDALAAAPRAGRDGGAVLIVDGGASALPEPIAQLLGEWAGTTYVQGVGGEASLSAALLRQAAGILNPEYPENALILPALSGKDRWAVAAAADGDNADSINNTVYIASGLSFPDALTVGPLVGAGGDRLILSRQTCIPAAQHNAFSPVPLTEVVIVGGPATLGPELFSLPRCA